MHKIDLRSDTVTCPTAAMWEAMSKADLGDDVYGEDPTVNALQEQAARKMGKEAALFVASGTMGNLIAILSHCGRGDEAIMGNLAHTFLYEAGGISALGGVHPHTVPNQADGTLRLDDIREAMRGEDVHYPTTRLIVLENTQNRCGGVPITAQYTRSVADLAHRNNILLHMDGARIFNAAAALNTPVEELAAPVDSITFCLSKGLCAPVGSVLCGSGEFIYKARRIRKQLGGGMRQAGVLAAAGLVALDEMTARLGEDHRRAKMLAQGLAAIQGLSLKDATPPSNMIFIQIDAQVALSDQEILARLKEKGILAGLSGPRLIRLVTHYWIDDAAVAQTLEVFKQVLA